VRCSPPAFSLRRNPPTSNRAIDSRRLIMARRPPSPPFLPKWSGCRLSTGAWSDRPEQSCEETQGAARILAVRGTPNAINGPRIASERPVRRSWLKPGGPLQPCSQPHCEHDSGQSAACGSPPRRAYRPYRRRGRVAEGGGLLNRYRVVKPYRGFESLRLRQPLFSRLFPRFPDTESRAAVDAHTANRSGFRGTKAGTARFCSVLGVVLPNDQRRSILY
jgi:hypothetical protein